MEWVALEGVPSTGGIHGTLVSLDDANSWKRSIGDLVQAHDVALAAMRDASGSLPDGLREVAEAEVAVMEHGREAWMASLSAWESRVAGVHSKMDSFLEGTFPASDPLPY